MENEHRQRLCDTVAEDVEVVLHLPGFIDVTAEETQEINSQDPITPERIISVTTVEDQMKKETRPQPTQETH